MGKLSGKKLLLLGERDGVPGPAMEACLKVFWRRDSILSDRMLCLNRGRSNGLAESAAY